MIERYPLEKAAEAYERMINGKENSTMGKNETTQGAARHRGAEETPTDLRQEAVEEISDHLRRLLADVFALYVKTKNFHWHMRGRYFRDYHLLLDEHADQIFAMTDAMAKRTRKIGATTIRSISDIARHQRLAADNNEDVGPGQGIMVLPQVVVPSSAGEQMLICNIPG